MAHIAAGVRGWTLRAGVVTRVGSQTQTLSVGQAAAVVPDVDPRGRQEGQPSPLLRASRAWTALKVSAVIESLAFLARGVDCGRPPRGAACPQHVLGPLVGTILGPVGGRLPQDCVEESFLRASHVRGVTREEWHEWRGSRFSPHLLEDVTMLAYRGSCAGRSDEVRCTCGGAADVDQGLAGTHAFDPALGPVPALLPDVTGRTDPWQDALVVLVSKFRGRGTLLASKYAGSGPPSINEIRTVAAHLERLAGAYAGPRRADRMSGLGRVAWNPPLRQTRASVVRDRAGGTDSAREELVERLLRAVGI